MKNTSILALAAVVLSSASACKKTGHKKFCHQNNTCNPAIYLPLDGNCMDISSNKNSVIVHGNPVSATDRFGNNNAAMEFNGSTDYLELKHISAYSGNSLIMTAWVYPKAFGTYDNGIKPLADYSGVFSKWEHSNKTGFSSYATDKQIRINGQFGDQSFYDFNSVKGSFLQLNQWQHIGYEICSGKIKLYLNGKAVAEKDYQNTSGLLTVTAPFEIGRTQWYPSKARMFSFFTGIIDDVKVYYNCCDVKIADIYQAKP